MVRRPNIKPGDWIRIGTVKAVVSVVRPENSKLGDLEVVFNPRKPTNHDVEWTGDEWTFAKRGDFGGYADRYPRLSLFVQQLRANRH